MTSTDHAETNGWTDKVAVVTGSAGPMGRSVAEALVAQGVRVAGLDLPGPLDASDLTHRNYFPIAADLADKAQISAAFAAVDEAWGRCDLLVNLAAVLSSPDSITDIPEEELHRAYAVNLAGTFWTCQEAARRMIPAKRGGSIVNISSLNGFMGRVQFPTHAYAATKGAVIGLTRSLAGELGAHQIRVNCIAPGLHVTPLANTVGGDPESTRVFFENAKKFTPLGRVADPSEMTGPILFFLSDASGNMTGQIVASDGGRSTWYQ